MNRAPPSTLIGLSCGKMEFLLIVWFLATTHSRAFQSTTLGTKCAFSRASETRTAYPLPLRRDLVLAKTRLHAETPSFPDRFSRWRFMQALLDEDINDDVINSTLFGVLNDYLQNPPSKSSSKEDNASPEFTPELGAKLEEALDMSKDNMLTVFTEETDETFLKKLEELLPDPQEDEDGFKSGWDILMELHGRELVKSNETNATPEWRKLCLVARLLIHYDFLTRGTK